MGKKGQRNEKRAADLYERAGYETYRPPRARGGPTDVFGLFDLLAFNDGKGLDMVQVKTNRAAGIEAYCRQTRRFAGTRGLCPLMLVRYDGQGGHQPTPARWRLIVPNGEAFWVDAVDERQDGVDGDGAAVVEYLRSK